MTNFHEQLQKEASRMKLADHEKSAMRAVLTHAMSPSSPHATVSPYMAYMWSVQRFSVFGVLVLLVLSGGTAVAAEDALPGDALYAVKVRVAEPITEILQFSPKAKATWHIAVAEKRAGEAEVLAAEGRLSPEVAAEIASNFDTHAAAALNHAAQVEAEDPESDGELSTKVVVTLQAHSAILAALGETAASSTVAHTATELATSFSSRTGSLLAYEPRTVGSEEPSGKHAGNEPVQPQSGEVVRTMSVTASGTTSDTISVQTATTAAATSSGTLPRPELKRIRATAVAAISALEKKLSAQAHAVEASETVQFETGLSDAKALISLGDAAAEEGASVQAYTQALRTALSLSAYLRANATFPNAKLLPTLLNSTAVELPGIKGEE